MPDCDDPDNTSRLDVLLNATAKTRLAADVAIERNKKAADPGQPRSQAVLTTADLRQARALLGWSSVTLARKAKVDYLAIVRAQLKQSPVALPHDVAAAIKAVFEAAGVRFGPDTPPRLAQGLEPRGSKRGPRPSARQPRS